MAIAQKRVLAAAEKRPGGILGRSQIETIERRGGEIAEQRVVHLSLAIIIAEEEPEGMLGIAGIAAETTPDAQPGVLLETRWTGVERIVDDLKRP